MPGWHELLGRMSSPTIIGFLFGNEKQGYVQEQASHSLLQRLPE